MSNLFGGNQLKGLPHQRALRNVVVGFGSLINNVRIPRFDSKGNVLQWIHVPLGLADKVEWYRLLKEKGDKDTSPITALKMPRMSMDLNEFTPDVGRQHNPAMMLQAMDPVRRRLLAVAPPIAMAGKISVDVVGATNGDCFAICEQILPLFRPTFVIPARVLPDLDLVVDIPYTLESCVRNHTIESDFSVIKMKSYTLKFDVRFEIYGSLAMFEQANAVNTAMSVGTNLSTIEEVDKMFAESIWSQPDLADPATLTNTLNDNTLDSATP